MTGGWTDDEQKQIGGPRGIRRSVNSSIRRSGLLHPDVLDDAEHVRDNVPSPDVQRHAVWTGTRRPARTAATAKAAATATPASTARTLNRVSAEVPLPAIESRQRRRRVDSDIL